MGYGSDWISKDLFKYTSFKLGATLSILQFDSETLRGAWNFPHCNP